MHILEQYVAWIQIGIFVFSILGAYFYLKAKLDYIVEAIKEGRIDRHDLWSRFDDLNKRIAHIEGRMNGSK
uniref:Holin n=1 Tax=viral metagenome TaxID=1070528 RepID=A0A6M3KXG4_9ZZZZ